MNTLWLKIEEKEKQVKSVKVTIARRKTKGKGETLEKLPHPLLASVPPPNQSGVPRQ